jgi:hypothetical protein
MQNRSNRGSGKPVWVKAHQARAIDWDPIPRIALGPAVMSTASTGRTHDCTRPACINLKIILANQEPSTHDPQRPNSASPMCRRPGSPPSSCQAPAKGTCFQRWWICTPNFLLVAHTENLG